MQFAVYLNKNPASRKRFPYLLDVQAELLDSLDSRVVVPLGPLAEARSVLLKGLMPVIEVDGHPYAAYVPQLAGVARHKLGDPVATAIEARSVVLAALDLLLTGV